jgi:hypothetical protein
MKRLWNAILLAVVGGAMLTSAALADGPSWMKRIAEPGKVEKINWTSIYFGGMGGWGVADTKLSSVEEGFSFDGVSGDGWRGDVKAGINYHLPNTPFVLRVHAGYNFGSTEPTLDMNDGAFHASGKFTPEWYGGGGLGLALSGRSMLYGDVSWQRAKLAVDWTGSQGACQRPTMASGTPSAWSTS